MQRCCVTNCHNNYVYQGFAIKVMAERRVSWVLPNLLVADAVGLFCSVYIDRKQNLYRQKIEVEIGENEHKLDYYFLAQGCAFSSGKQLGIAFS